MEVAVKLTVELGEKTIALINSFCNTAATPKAQPVAAPVKEAAAATPKAQTTAPAKEAAAPTPKAQSKAATKVAEPVFEDLDADAQLEEIKTEITRHTKKGKSGDIKVLLSAHSVARASELEPGQYGDFFTALKRYAAGEPLADIIAENDMI